MSDEAEAPGVPSKSQRADLENSGLVGRCWKLQYFNILFLGYPQNLLGLSTRSDYAVACAQVGETSTNPFGNEGGKRSAKVVSEVAPAEDQSTNRNNRSMMFLLVDQDGRSLKSQFLHELLLDRSFWKFIPHLTQVMNFESCDFSGWNKITSKGIVEAEKAQQATPKSFAEISTAMKTIKKHQETAKKQQRTTSKSTSRQEDPTNKLNNPQQTNQLQEPTM